MGVFVFTLLTVFIAMLPDLMGFFLIRTQDPRALLNLLYRPAMRSLGETLKKIKFMISFDENDVSFNFIISLL